MELDKLIDSEKMPELLFASDGRDSRLWINGREVANLIAVNIDARRGNFTICKTEFAVVPV